MEDKKSFYITTTLPYVNAEPHIGFALEIIQADALARWQRLNGREVFFNTGSDEHGQKIFEAAEAVGQDVKEYVDHYAGTFEKLKNALNLSYDRFIRTSEPEHVKAAEEMWKRCKEKGDIYEKEFEGLYCVGCERFLSERDMQDGKCVIHGTEPKLLKEKNWFFKFSNYQDALLKYLSDPSVIIPDWRREEALNFVKEGLEDFSISREKSRLAWGIPVPGDESQVMYVWFDALTNYISTLGWPNEGGNFEKFWTNGHVLQLAGKDQVRFQSLMWQAMLMSAGVKNTDQVFYHGFINSGGQKMSKSLGNVLSPYALVEKYGTDATRYLLLRHVHSTEDTDVTWEKLDEWYNAHLVNGLGNLTSRIMKMAETNLSEAPKIPEESIPQEFKNALERYDFNGACEIVWKKIGELDGRIQSSEPFKLVKTDPEKGKAIISELARELYTVGRMLNPLMPEANVAIKALVKANKTPEKPLFPRLTL